MTQAQVDVLLAFEGFGRLESPVWFLGMEEAGADPQLIQKRAGCKPVMDLEKSHVESLRIDKHHRASIPSVVLQSTWRPMCVLMVLGEAPELYAPFPAVFDDLPREEQRSHRHQRKKLIQALKRYQSTRLGRDGDAGETFLCELLPLPKPAENNYPFEELLPMWRGHEHYKEDVLPARKELLSGRIAAHRPEVVLAYGKAFWDEYRDLFPNTRFAVATQEQRDALPSWFQGGSIPDEQHSEILFGLAYDRTLVVLTMHLTWMNDYARLSELAGLIRAHRQQLAR